MNSAQKTIRIMVSMGDPAGIGPELCLKMLSDRRWCDLSGAALTVTGSLEVLHCAARFCGIKFDPKCVREPVGKAGETAVMNMSGVDASKAFASGGPSKAGGRATMHYIEAAAKEVISGRADALVTCPVSKEALSAAGCTHPGHTEILGELSGSKSDPVMMMLGNGLRVAFVTTHVAFRKLPDALAIDKIIHTAEVFSDALRKYFGIDREKIALCALNPHAGDGGRFGDEENTLLRPAILHLQKQGMDVSGPLPSDTLFYRAAEGMYNGVIALYHDQGMIPVKMSGPGDVVNVTIGLPLIRTSPAHGTAYDIAGKGIADPTSLKNAVLTAVEMVEKK